MSSKWLIGAIVTAAASLPSLARADATLDPARATLGRGVAAVVAGNFGDGEKDIREALRLDPSLGAPAHYNLAVALRNEGRYDEAIEQYRVAFAASTSEPERAAALYGVGLAKESLGQHDAWNEYLAFARPKKVEQPAVRVAEEHRDVLNGARVPGTQKAAR